MSEIQETDSSSGIAFSVQGSRSVLEQQIEAPSYLARLRELESEEDPLQALLRLGSEWLEVEHGHLTHIDVADGTHTIAAVSGPHPAVSRGETRDLSTTYCRTVIAENAVLAVRNAPEEGWSEDAAYEEFGFSTYLGAKVVMDGALYGTLCFADRTARESPFTEDDAAAMHLLARTAGQLLSERRRANSQAQPTEAQLEALFEHSPNMITFHDEDGNLIAPNPPFCRKTGYRADELIGMKVWELDREVTPTRARVLWSDMEPDERYRWEGTYQRKDGSTFPVEVDLRCIDVGGENRFVVTSRDTTERKKAERELRDTKRLLETTLESLAEAVVVVNPAEREIITCNAAVEEIFGYEKEELIGESTEKLHKSPEAYERFGLISESVLEEEGIFKDEYQMRRKDGKIIDTEHVITPLQNENRPEGVVSIIRDITERKEAEQQLREEHDLLDRILETSPVAIAVFNTEGEFIEASGRAEDILGLERDEVTSRTYNDPAWRIRGPDGGPLPDEDLPFARVMATAEPVYDVEHMIEWPDGTQRLLSVSGAPLHDSDGELEGAVFHIDDITEQRAAKQALQDERDRFATLFHNFPTPIVHGRPDDEGRLRIQAVNDRFEAAFGYEEQSVQGEDLQELIVPDEEKEGAASLRRRLLGGVPVQQEVRRWAADGLRDFRLQVALREDHDGPSEGFAIYTDVTERNEREQTLARRTALLEAQAEATIDGLLVVDNDREIAFFNDRFLEIWDLPRAVLDDPQSDACEAAFLEAVSDLLPDPEAFREKIEYLYDHPGKESRDVIRLTDGRWLDRYSAPIVGPDGNHFGRLWTFRDVTEQRRMMTRLLEVQEEERRRIDQEIHDEMGGLLTSLQFTVDLARRTAPDGSSTEHFDQLETFVSDLSTVSRTISRKLYPSDLSQHGLDEALPSLVNEMQKNRNLEVDLYSEIETEDRFSVLIERTVYWIVQETLLNIARYDDAEAAQVIVSKRGKRLYLHVFDEGARLTSSSPGTDGSFRLEAIRRRVEWLDGDVRIDSIPDEGIRLSVTLPVRLPFPPR